MTRPIRSRCLRHPYLLIKLIALVHFIGLLMCALNSYKHRATPLPPPLTTTTTQKRESLASFDRFNPSQRPGTSSGRVVGDELIATIARPEVQLRQPLTILVWNSKNDRWNFKVDLRPAVGNVTSGRRRQCVYSTDKTWYNASAGVLFYGDLMHLSKFPTGKRPHGQKWIYLSVETPVNTIHTGEIISLYTFIYSLRMQLAKSL